MQGMLSPASNTNHNISTSSKAELLTDYTVLGIATLQKIDKHKDNRSHDIIQL